MFDGAASAWRLPSGTICIAIDVGAHILFILRLRPNLLSRLSRTSGGGGGGGVWVGADYLGPRAIITKIIILTFYVKRGDFLEIRTHRTNSAPL